MAVQISWLRGRVLARETLGINTYFDSCTVGLLLRDGFICILWNNSVSSHESLVAVIMEEFHFHQWVGCLFVCLWGLKKEEVQRERKPRWGACRATLAGGRLHAKLFLPGPKPAGSEVLRARPRDARVCPLDSR